MKYQYGAYDARGRHQKGVIEADRPREAQRLLQQQGLTVSEIAPLVTGGKRRFGKSRKLKSQDLYLALEELSLLLDAGVPLVSAVGGLTAETSQPELSAGFGIVERGLKSGEDFGTALKAGMPLYPDYVFRMVEAGQATGQLSRALKDGGAEMAYEESVRGEIRNALTYPAILILAGITAILFIFVVVVPRFASMINRTGAEVPWISAAVINTGLFFNENLGALLITLAALVALAVALSRRPEVRLAVQEAAYRLPVLGGWLREAEVARWAGMLSTMLGNRVPVLEAMQMARSGAGLQSFRAKLDLAERLVKGGQGLAKALSKQQILTDTAINLIRVGEEAGQLPEMLRSVWRLYDKSGRDRMKRFLLLLEPAAIIVIGGMVGIIVTAIMLAITSINQISL